MGHDIRATAMVRKIRTEVAEISFSAFNTTAQTLFYGCLDAQQYNNLTSGNGDFHTYSRAEIETALSKLDYLETEDLAGFEKAGKNPIQDLLGALTGSEVLDNGTLIVNHAGPKIVTPVKIRTDSEDVSFQASRVRAFLAEIIDSELEMVEIDFS